MAGKVKRKKKPLSRSIKLISNELHRVRARKKYWFDIDRRFYLSHNGQHNESSFIVNRVDFLGSAISDWVDNLGFAIHFGNGWKWLHINENILS